MKNIKGTIGLPLLLSMDKSVHIEWYIDAEFAVHKFMRIQAGGFMTIETGGAYVQSRKKLNTKSSTEAKIFGVDDVLTQVIWTL